MATNYQHRWGQTEEARRQPRTSQTVPAATVTDWSLCPHCARKQPTSRLVGHGCFACHQMPHRPGATWPLIQEQTS